MSPDFKKIQCTYFICRCRSAKGGSAWSLKLSLEIPGFRWIYKELIRLQDQILTFLLQRRHQAGKTKLQKTSMISNIFLIWRRCWVFLDSGSYGPPLSLTASWSKCDKTQAPWQPLIWKPSRKQTRWLNSILQKNVINRKFCLKMTVAFGSNQMGKWKFTANLNF